MPRFLIIDGYNAIAKIKDLEVKKDVSLEAARLQLINMLNDFMARKDIFDRTFIVFDSAQEGLGTRRERHGFVEAIFATRDRDADSVIVDILRRASSKDLITVSSDDNFVKNHARAFGRDVISVSELEDIIILKKRHSESTIKTKALEGRKIKDINEELRKHWGIK